jgi:hypothetical protein
MTEPFDPYTTWLDIPAPHGPPSYYQLLGLPNFVADLATIRMQADAVLTRFNAIAAGPHQKAWNKLQQELVMAKLCLCDAARKRSYDEQLQRSLTVSHSVTTVSSPLQANANPTSPQWADEADEEDLPLLPSWSQADFLPPTTTRRPMAEIKPEAQAASPAPVAVAAQPVAAKRDEMPMSSPAAPQAYPAVAAPRAPASAPARPIPAQAGSPPMPDSLVMMFNPSYIMAGGAVILLLAIVYVVTNRLLPKPANVAQATISGSGELVEPAGMAEIVPPTSPPMVSVATPIESKLSPDKETDRPKTRDDAGTIVAKKDSGNTRRPQNGQSAADASQVAVAPATVDDDELASDDFSADESEEPAGGNERPAEQSPEDAAAFKSAAEDVRTALGARNLPRAKESLTKAMSLAVTAEQTNLAARLEMLFNYVEGFWRAVVKSMVGLQATDVIPVGNTEVAVVEVDEESITLRAAGRNESYTLKDMPVELALLLAERWFQKGVAANKLYLGAFLAVEPKGDKRQARRYWEEATRDGASAEDLLPLLDLPQSRAGRGNRSQPPPKRSQVTRARQAVKQRFVAEMRLAKSPEHKQQLARELLDLASQSDDPVEQCALLEETLPLAIQSQSADEVLATVEALADAYQTDVWKLLASSFDKLATTSGMQPETAQQLAEVALEKATEAAEGKQSAAAKSLAATAALAAKRAKDISLVTRALELKNRLSEEP